ncbi:MAG: RNA polymerase factor sigma-54 [Thermaurantiacus sp.]
MALGPRLDLRTSQTLVISPQLQAAIKLLALTNLELEAEINAELERNPLLELADDDRPAGPDGDRESAPVSETDDTPHSLDQDLGASDSTPSADELDVDYVEERFHHDSAADSGRGTGEEQGFSIDSVGEDAESLADVLLRQAGEELSGIDLAIAHQIIGLLDEAGYLTDAIEEIADRLGIELAVAERVLAAIQTFEPSGVGARNLAECLAIQAREADRYDPCMQALIANLDLVARGDVQRLKRICGVDDEDFADMLVELRSYDPKPGLRHGSGRMQPVVPDVFVRRARGGWQVELNTATLPRLIVNRRYQAVLQAHASHANGNGSARAERQYLASCVSQAQWLVKALDQRANTILKVATEIVRSQEAFFDQGFAHLKPMTMRQLADAIEMHESTVSRVVANKSMMCERGLLELRTFFTHAIHSTDGGEDVSATVVKARVKELIEAEEPLKPLSDDKLVRALQAEGHDIARRTVTKYREAMNIPSSFDRRRRALIGTV